EKSKKSLIFSRSQEIYKYTSETINPKDHEWWYLWKKKKKTGSKDDKDDDESADSDKDKSKKDEHPDSKRRGSSLPNLDQNKDKADTEKIYELQTSKSPQKSSKKSILAKKTK
ncbi:unnamed protein product, partial [Gordionus sp. m RMFG-2023]